VTTAVENLRRPEDQNVVSRQITRTGGEWIEIPSVRHSILCKHRVLEKREIVEGRSVEDLVHFGVKPWVIAEVAGGRGLVQRS
jgi:hypothetical protein